MCNNYKPSEIDRIHSVYRIDVAGVGDYPRETWPDYAAPIVRQRADGVRECVVANFGFVPKRRLPPGKSFDTTNARSETVGQKPTFAKYWRAAQLCLVPAQALFEPNYEADPKKSTRYRIWLKDEPDFAIAGLWRSWDARVADSLAPTESFTMLTVNADEHPLMRRMHAPGKEKRSVVVVPRDHWEAWLSCRDPEVARTFLTLYPAERMATEPAPRTPRPTKQAPKESASGGLF
ncbi:SOS response-associated peptidase [Ralstonia holmesii]|uniref:SOS response-associated peptidase n=1 Tax=Ralstonia TaxID=48736 RepID=UPI00046A501F|nr:SOS response-associated peptidase family protein [Ralstonia pickettii]